MSIELTQLASIATIVGVPISLLALLIGYLSLKGKIKSTDSRVDTLKDIVQLNQKYNSDGPQYNNCTFNDSPLDNAQVQNQFKTQEKIGEENE
jgi:hypothetical protein